MTELFSAHHHISASKQARVASVEELRALLVIRENENKELSLRGPSPVDLKPSAKGTQATFAQVL